MSRILNLAAWSLRVTTLGPGQRIVLWTQGCLAACPGCISPEWRPLGPATLMDVAQLTTWILANRQGHTGLTISGGEPMLQATSLLYLWKGLAQEIPNWTLVLYSGYTCRQLTEHFGSSCHDLLDLCDAFIGGPYLAELDDGIGLRGSSNQEIYFPPLSRIQVRDRQIFFQQPRRRQIVVSDSEIYLVGLPSPHPMESPQL